MKIVALSAAAGVLLAGLSASQAGDFAVHVQLQPTYTDTVNGADDFYVRGKIEATATGKLGRPVRLRVRRHSDLGALRRPDRAERRLRIGEASISTVIADFNHSLSATSVTIFGPFFNTYQGEIVDLAWSVSRSFPVGHDLSLVPGLALTRRLANTPGSERVQLSPSIELDFHLWHGFMAISADYGYDDYDIGGRIDHGFDASVTWSRRLNKRLVVGMAASFSAVESNIQGSSYQIFEIGPKLTVDLGK
ncbi:MAG: hypothetical protein WDN31_12155 [Hyphomicrobium sp.]